VGLQHAIDAGFASCLDTIASLDNVNAIASLVDTLGGFHTHSSTFGLDVLAEFFDKQLASGWVA
jgi:hypothetical protein